MKRFQQMYDLLTELKPKIVVEVGTWNGKNAAKMMECCPGAKYYGFDLFEDSTEEDRCLEFNNKSPCTMEQATEALNGFEYELVKGNTRETLSEFSNNCFRRKQGVDFVFIDGGHSVETIQSDWSNIKPLMKPGGVVIFDDFYTWMPSEMISKIGCNKVLEKAVRNAVILPDCDFLPWGLGENVKIKGTGVVHLAKVQF